MSLERRPASVEIGKSLWNCENCQLLEKRPAHQTFDGTL